MAHGLQRVAVVDFDVHHGNGTQNSFFSDPSVLYASTHQRGIYPGSGRADETGVAANIVNLPFPAGTGSMPWRQAVTNLMLPRLQSFRPDMILISAGFDAHHADPLAHMRLFPEDFHWITAELMAIAKRWCQGRLVSSLEGGYDLEGLAQSSAAHVRALMGRGAGFY
jgi:acetoin utilization deacetylase AcuC-like enzyme